MQNIQNELKYNVAHHMVMALSRKTCIGEMTFKKVEDRLPGTLTANLLAMENGATILRVHDVKETKDMLLVYRGLYE